MEVSATLYIKSKNAKLIDFIYSIWGLETQPVTEEDVEPEFVSTFKALEFLDEPDIKDKVSTTEIIGFYDCLGGLEALEEIAEPYRDIGIDTLIVAIYGDEGPEWYKIEDGQNIQEFRPRKIKWTDDILEDLKLVAARVSGEA